MLWRLKLAGRYAHLNLLVLATDIDAALLKRAATACYRASTLKDVSAVVDAADAAGRARKVARTEPLICVKG